MTNPFSLFTEKCKRCSAYLPYSGRGRRPEVCKPCGVWIANHSFNAECSLCKRGYRTYPSWHLRRRGGLENNWNVSGRVLCKRCFKTISGRARTKVIPDYCPFTTVQHLSGRTYLVEKRTGKRMLRYRLIMECILGRPLDWDEVVHHIDGDHTNDSPENLELTNRTDHIRKHIEERRASGEEWPVVAANKRRWAALRRERVCSDCGKMFVAYKREQCMKCASKRRYEERKRRSAEGA